MKFLLLTTIFILSFSVLGNIEIDPLSKCWPSSFSTNDKKNAGIFIQNQFQRYPKILTSQLPKIKVCFKKMLSSHSHRIGESTRTTLLTQNSTLHINLDQNLIEPIVQKQSQNKVKIWPPFTDFEMAQKSLLHELAHLIDDRFHFSKQPNYHILYKADLYGKRNADPYEKTTIKEHFAVNVEFYFLDPHYPQRRPLHFKFLNKIFGFSHKDYLTKQDQLYVSLLDIIHSFEKKTDELDYHYIDLKKKKLYAIDYVWAGVGEKMASKFGHTFFRLVYCSEEREKASEECYNDTAEHLAIGYVYSPNSFDEMGLKFYGKNRGEITISHFQQTLIDYTQLKLRDLYALRLHLTEEEKENFLEWVAYMNWAGGFNYDVLWQNCSSKAKEHLALCGEGWPPIKKLTPLRPRHLIKELIQHKKLNKEKKLFSKNKSNEFISESIDKNIFYPSYSYYLNQIFNKIKSICPAIAEKNFSQFNQKGATYRYDQFAKCIQKISQVELFFTLNLKDSEIIDQIDGHPYDITSKTPIFSKDQFKQIKESFNEESNIADYFAFLETYLYDINRNRFTKKIMSERIKKLNSNNDLKEKLTNIYFKKDDAASNLSASQYGLPLINEVDFQNHNIKNFDEVKNEFNSYLKSIYFAEYKNLTIQKFYLYLFKQYQLDILLPL